MPVILYNIPKMSGVSFGTEELVELLAHDGIVGVKQTTMDLMQTEALVRTCRDKAVFNGHDEILLPALSVGVRASIGSTFSIMADVFVQLKKAFDAGDMERARYLQGKGNGMIRTLLEIGIFRAQAPGDRLRQLHQAVPAAEARRLSKTREGARGSVRRGDRLIRSPRSTGRPGAARQRLPGRLAALSMMNSYR